MKRIALLAAVMDELRPTLALLGARRQGPWWHARTAAAEVALAVTGIGGDRMLQTLELLISDHEPEALILVGFSGGLSDEVAGGQAVQAAWVLDGHGNAVRLADDRPPTVITGTQTRQPRATVLTLDHVLHDPAAKRQLGQRHGAAMVDMESFHVAFAAAERALPMTILRAISDTADMALPASIEQWVSPEGEPRLGPAVSHALTHPWDIPTMLRLQRHAHRGSQAIARQVAALLEGGPRASARG